MGFWSKKIVVILMVGLLLVSLAAAKKTSKKAAAAGRKRQMEKQSSHKHEHSFLKPHQLDFWLNALLATFLALAGGFCSGMTVGLNSLSVLQLEVMEKSSDEHDKKMAQRILAVISDHHLFLTTLLVGNAIVLESLPLVIHTIMPDWAAILFSTVVVLIVAEVVPMSMSTGPQKYIIAYYGAPLVKILIKLFFLVCYPIARGLDRLLGTDHEERIYRRDFLTFINDKKKNFLEKLEIGFINQVMNYQNKTVKELMVPYGELFMVEENEPITERLMGDISSREYSFILIYRRDRNNIIGYAKTKEVILNYMRIPKNKTPNVIELVHGRVCSAIVRVYNDAVAIEALSILEAYKTRVLLVCEDSKHRAHAENEALSSITVYDCGEWVLGPEAKVIGVITLNQVLYEIADYRTTALKTTERKLSQRSEEGGL